VGHLTAENQELMLKLKQLSGYSIQLRTRVVELNVMVRDLVQGKEGMDLFEENEKLREQIAKMQTNKNESEVQQNEVEGSFFNGIQIAGNNKPEDNSRIVGDQNLFD